MVAETPRLFSSIVYEILNALPTFSLLRAQNGSTITRRIRSPEDFLLC